MAENQENTNQNAEQAQAEQQPQMVIQLKRCYFKDASLEMPHAPEIFSQEMEEQPVVDIQFEVGTVQLPVQDHYEVTVRGTVTVKTKDADVFLVEGKQAGIFEVAGFEEGALHYILNVKCPETVYPYLRANVADLISRTTLPPVHLPEVNFEMLFQQRMAEAAQQAQASVAAPQGQA